MVVRVELLFLSKSFERKRILPPVNQTEAEPSAWSPLETPHLFYGEVNGKIHPFW